MDYLNVSKITLQRWDNSGKLPAVRTSGGHRRYKLSDLERFIGEDKEEDILDGDIVVATYARCSTSDQKQHGDIDRQSQRLSEYCAKKKYKVEYIIKDMGSGINDKRKGFMKLCNLVVNQKVNKVVIEHKDRLTRFQYNLIEFFFKSYGVDIELTDKKEYTEQEELVNDMMMLIASFSGRLYSARARENNKKRKEFITSKVKLMEKPTDDEILHDIYTGASRLSELTNSILLGSRMHDHSYHAGEETWTFPDGVREKIEDDKKYDVYYETHTPSDPYDTSSHHHVYYIEEI
jgi:putative resolvase